MNSTLALEDVLMLEQVEADVLEQMHQVAPRTMVEALGLGFARVGSASVSWAPRTDTLIYNRALGIGLSEPVTEALIDDVLDRVRRVGSPRFFFQVAPGAQPRELPQWLEARGLPLHNRWAKLHRGAIAPPHVDTDLRVDLVGRHQAEAFGEIVAGAFEHDEPLKEWYAATVGQKNWMHYAAFDGATPVAAAAMYVANGVANFSFAGTRASHRGRGAQSALIARRIDDAIELKCRKLIVETAEETPEKPSPSFRNVRRLGFELAYLRPNYIWKAS